MKFGLDHLPVIPKRLRVARVRDADIRELRGKPCAICGSKHRTQIDHIIPASRGGSRERSNLRSLCELCNGLKGNRLTDDEIRAHPNFIARMRDSQPAARPFRK